MRRNIKKSSLEEIKSAKSPLADTKQFTIDDSSKTTDRPYRAAIRSLLYCALSNRPDIFYPIILLSRFSTEPKEKRWHAAMRIMRYLKGTQNQALVLEPSSEKIEPVVYTEAEWAGDLKT